jgi:hypothetical protein
MVGGKRILAALTAGAICSVAIGLVLHPDPPSHPDRFMAPGSRVSSFETAGGSGFGEATSMRFASVETTVPARPVYRHSIVPGGVYSRPEVEEAMYRMPEVAEHYRGVNLHNLTPAQVSRDGMYFASYKRSGVVYWTSYRLRVPSGEQVLTDGKTMIRSRCGNMLSEEQLSPVLPPELEPPEPEMSTVEVPMLPPMVVPPISHGYWIPILPIIPVLVFSGGSDGGHVVPPTPVVPEPSPLALVVIGLAAIAGSRLLVEWRRRAVLRRQRE